MLAPTASSVVEFLMWRFNILFHSCDWTSVLILALARIRGCAFHFFCDAFAWALPASPTSQANQASRAARPQLGSQTVGRGKHWLALLALQELTCLRDATSTFPQADCTTQLNTVMHVLLMLLPCSCNGSFGSLGVAPSAHVGIRKLVKRLFN